MVRLRHDANDNSLVILVKEYEGYDPTDLGSSTSGNVSSISYIFAPSEFTCPTSATFSNDVNVSGNIIGVDASLSGSLTANVTGNVTGDITGNVTGSVTGNVTGDVTGNVTGDITGNVTGNLNGDSVTAANVYLERLYVNSTPPTWVSHYEIDTEDDPENFPGSFIGDSGSIVDPGIDILEISHPTSQMVGSARNWIYTFNPDGIASRSGYNYYQWLFIFQNVGEYTWADVEFKENASNAAYAVDKSNTTWCSSGKITENTSFTNGASVNLTNADFYVIVRRFGTFKGDTYSIKVNLYDSV